MNKKYNLALVPLTQNDTFIALANQFQRVSDQYILGPNSLPHITLRQFYADPNEVEAIGIEASKIIPIPLHISLASFSFTTSNDEVFWISLIPNQHERLFQLHQKISSLLNMSINENYYPHLTLCNTLRPNCETLITAEEQVYKTISDDFKLALGDCDAIGQFVRHYENERC